MRRAAPTNTSISAGGKEFVALSKEERHQIRNLYRRSNSRGVLQLGAHLLLIGLAIFFVQQSLDSPRYLFAALALGGIMTFLFAPLHECIHRTAFRTRILNDVVATVAGFLLLLPPSYFREFHLHHHRHTQVEERDPELADKKLDTFGQFLIHLSGYRYWRSNLVALAQHCMGQINEPYISPQKMPIVILEARCFAVGYGLCLIISLLTNNVALAAYWLIPILLGQPILRLYLLAEHTLCPLTTDMLQNSRTTLTHPLLRFLSWNMTYHAEHHASMAIPFHALPAAHLLFRSRVTTLTPGYLAFYRQLFSTLRLR